LKESSTAREIFTTRLEIYQSQVLKLKDKPRELFNFLETHKTEIVKKLRGGERSGSKESSLVKSLK
jgi:hypothetical protein